MAFALTFCPGVGWLIINFKHLVPSIAFEIPLIGINYTVWRMFVLLCSMLSGTVMILLFFVPESPKFLLAHEKHDEALKILKDINRWNKKTESAFGVHAISLNELLIKKTTEPQNILQQVCHF